MSFDDSEKALQTLASQNRDKGEERDDQQFQMAAERVVAGTLPDVPVKFEIRLRRLVVAICLDRGVESLQSAFEFLELRVTHPLRSGLGCLYFEHRP